MFPREALSTHPNQEGWYRLSQAGGSRCRQPDATLLQAFAEYFTQMQLTTLVLTAMEGLTDSRAKVSLAAAQLMSAVMKERGRDMIKVGWCCGGSSALHTWSLGSLLALFLTIFKSLGKSLSSRDLNSFTSKM